MAKPWPILLLGETSLRERSAEVDVVNVTPELAEECSALVATLDDFRARMGFGRAISAPQIGIQKRIIAINLDDGRPSFAMLNPVITARSEATMTLWDDCFSFPWLLVRVRRHRSVSVLFSRLDGSSEMWEQLPEPRSELLQHEIDHLDGVLAVDIALPASELPDKLGSFVSREVFDKERAAFEAVVDYTIPPPPQTEKKTEHNSRYATRSKTKAAQLECNSAVSFIKVVKQSTNDEMYRDFLDALHTYHKSQDVRQVIAKIKEIFRKHPHLLRGVNEFFPEHSQLSEEEIADYEAECGGIDRSWRKPKKKRPHLHINDDVYATILDIMKEFKQRAIINNDVATKVMTLLSHDRKLLLGLNLFLPPSQLPNQVGRRLTWMLLQLPVLVWVGIVAVIVAVLVVLGFVAYGTYRYKTTETAASLNELMDEYWNLYLDSNPISATFVGVENKKRLNRIWPNVTAAANDAELKQYQGLQNKLGKVTRSLLSAEDEVNWQVLNATLHYQSLPLNWHTYEVVYSQTQFEGSWLTIPQVIKATPFNSEDDYDNYLTRLHALGPYINAVQSGLANGLSANISIPRVIASLIPAQIQELLNVTPRSSIFYEPWLRRNISDDKSSEALTVIETNVYGAFRDLKNFYNQTYIPQARTSIGAEDLPNGKAFYQSRIDYFTTSGLNASAIHQTGMNEVTRIRTSMDAIAAKNNMTFQEFVAFLRNDTQFYAKTEKEFLEFVRNIAKRADAQLPALFGRLPRCPYGVVPIPATEAPTAYYQQPDAACTRAGMYNVNTYDLHSRPLYNTESTTLHEAVPGHHLQLALSQESDLPMFRAYGDWNAYIEGWALYAESLGSIMGFYEDDYFQFGRYTDEIFRACRLVVDTGMHALGWSRQKAIDFMYDNSGLGMTDIVAEVDRYIAWPGQALGYKLGELKILEVRMDLEKAIKTANQTWSIREFHDAILHNGALPLDLMRTIAIDQFCTTHSLKDSLCTSR